MTERYAGMSDEAAACYQQMLDEGMTIPERDNLQAYRDEIRAGFEAFVQAALAGFEGRIEMLEIDGVACRQITPAGWQADSGRCMLYAYGGGYVSGSTHEDQIIAVPLARLAGVRIVMPEYRLSPEHPYPAPQQDMRRVYAALLEHYDAARLIVGGESAGSNQALGLMHYARDRGLALPRCAVLLSPWCDLANQGDSHIFNDGRDPTLDNTWVDRAAAWHAGDTALDDPGLSPLHGDMSGLPPCIITTGSRDLLMSQCLRLAARLRAAGVECDLRVWDGLWHVFEFYPIPEAQRSLAEIAAFIEAH
jgi:monoterpene epsilon-lactone hydrolase